MYKGKSKLLPIVLVIIVAAVAIFALVSVGRAILNRDEDVEVVDTSADRALLTAEADRSVRMTVRGPIQADEEFHSYEIEVSPIGRRMTTYRGYQNESIDNIQLGNSVAAYDEFVHALSRANFTSEEQLSEDSEEERGACASGRLYAFETLQAQSVTKRLWVTSCKDLPASFMGDAVFIRDLFQKQIPDSSRLLRTLNL